MGIASFPYLWWTDSDRRARVAVFMSYVTWTGDDWEARRSFQLPSYAAIKLFPPASKEKRCCYYVTPTFLRQPTL